MKNTLRLVTSYVMVFSTPLLSAFLIFGSYALALYQQNYLVPIVIHVGINLAVTAVLIVGVVLYFLEYKENLMTGAHAQIIFILSILLVLWGAFVAFMALGFYFDLIEWSRMPEVRELTVWDYLEYALWILKGTLWMISGILLTITSTRAKKVAALSPQLQQTRQCSHKEPRSIDYREDQITAVDFSLPFFARAASRDIPDIFRGFSVL